MVVEEIGVKPVIVRPFEDVKTGEVRELGLCGKFIHAT